MTECVESTSGAITTIGPYALGDLVTCDASGTPGMIVKVRASSLSPLSLLSPPSHSLFFFSSSPRFSGTPGMIVKARSPHCSRLL